MPLPALMRTLGVPSRVSVVVPTYRRPRLLGRCLAALVMQSLPPHAYEIIVCDDGCDADTHEMVASYAARFHAGGWRIVYVPVADTQGPAGARNRGWRVARSDVIAFTDDDTIPDRHWLERGLAALRGGAAAVAGRIQVPLPSRPTDYELDAAGLARAEFATANCFVHRAMLEQVGGFDARYTSAWREDSDLQFAILRAGGTIGRAEDAVVLHPVRPARFGVSLAQQRKSQFDALLCKNHRKLYRTRVARAPPWRYYAIIASAAVACGAALGGAPHVALAAGASWALLTLGFVRRRLRRTARTPQHVAEMVVTSVAIPFLSVFWRLYGALKFRVVFL
ncbi:MAG: glycosyltransferase family A protein [Burkholderiales bacterium]